jgi:hypothetical protein
MNFFNKLAFEAGVLAKRINKALESVSPATVCKHESNKVFMDVIKDNTEMMKIIMDELIEEQVKKNSAKK